MGKNTLNEKLQKECDELKQQVAALKQELQIHKYSSEKYRSIYESFPAPSFSLDQEGQIIAANTAWLNMLGYDQSKVISSHIIEYIHPEWRTKFKNQYPSANEFIGKPLKLQHSKGHFLQQVYDCTTGYYTDGSHQIIFILRGENVNKNDYTPLNILAEINEHLQYLKDKTDQKLVRKALEKAIGHAKEREQFIQKIFDTTPNILYVYDVVEHKTVFQNRHVAASIGYSANEILEMGGELLSKLAHPDDLPIILEHFKQLNKVESGEIIDLEYRMRHKNGQWRWFQSKDTVFKRDYDGSAKQIIGTAADITERKESERKFYESEKRLKEAQQMAKLGDFSWNVETGEITWSDGMYEILKVDKTETINFAKINEEFFYPKDYAQIHSWLHYNFSSNSHILPPNEYRLRRKDGKIIYVRTNGVIVRKNRKPIKVFATVQDITEQKNAEEALQQSEERYQSFINQSSEGIYRLELEEPLDVSLPTEEQVDHIYENAYIAECNEAFVKMYEAESTDALINSRLVELHGGSDNPKNREVVRRFIQLNYRIVGEESLERDNYGNEHWFSNNTVGIIENGKLVRMWGTQLDITKRKLALNAMQESKKRLIEAQRIAKLGDFKWDVDSGQVTWSDAMYDLLGYDPTDQINFDKVNTHIHHSEDIEKVNNWLKKCIDSGTGKLTPNEYRLIKKDGTVIFVRTKGVIDYNKGGSPIVFATVQDITERKQAEEQIKSQKERLSNILEGTNVGTWEWNVQTGETIFNEKWARIIGYTLEELAPVSIETWMKYAHPDDLQEGNELLEKHFKGELDYYHYECRMRHRNGNWIWVLDRGKVVSWTDDGKPLWMFGTHQEITQRRQMEEAIIQERNLSNVIIDSAPGMFYLFDEKGHFLRWNKNFEINTGYSPKEISNMHPLDLFRGKHKTLIKKRIQKVFDIGSADAEADLTTKDGCQIPYIFTGNKIVFNNKPCLIGLGFDITERKKADEAIRQHNEELKKTNQELDNFVYRVSHDIRAPISSTKGLVHIAKLERDKDSVTTCLKRIEESMNKLDSFILDILDYSRNSRVAVEREAIDFNELIDQILLNTKYLQKEKKISVEKKIPLKGTFYSDKRRLLFIFNNMISNAIRFADDNKQHSYLNISIDITDQLAILKFSDNGVGVPSEHQDRIFEMFYRANEFTQGSGLGLYIVKEAVDKLNGKIQLISRQYEGTTFIIELPNMKKAENKK